MSGWTPPSGSSLNHYFNSAFPFPQVAHGSSNGGNLEASHRSTYIPVSTVADFHSSQARTDSPYNGSTGLGHVGRTNPPPEWETGHLQDSSDLTRGAGAQFSPPSPFGYYHGREAADHAAELPTSSTTFVNPALTLRQPFDAPAWVPPQTSPSIYTNSLGHANQIPHPNLLPRTDLLPHPANQSPYTAPPFNTRPVSQASLIYYSNSNPYADSPILQRNEPPHASLPPNWEPRHTDLSLHSPPYSSTNAGPLSTAPISIPSEQGHNPQSQNQTKRCSFCDKTFRHPKYTRRHENAKHFNWRELKCEVPACEYAVKGFTREDALKRHRKKKHGLD